MLLVAILLCANVVEAQITLDDYRQDVARHSHTIGISNSEVDASLMDVKRARKGYLPSVVSYRTMSYAFDKQGDERRFDWSMRPEINQTVYAGGAVRAAVKQAEARYDASIGSADEANLTVWIREAYKRGKESRPRRRRDACCGRRPAMRDPRPPAQRPVRGRSPYA